MSTNILTEEQWHEKYLQTLENYRPIDDDFFTKLFQDNIPLAEKVLRIITDVKDLHLTSIKTQETLKKLAGSRSVRFDAFGHDNLNREFDIEVQRADSGASPKRARYHSSSIDTNYLKAGQDFDVLPTTYVIFITENDIFGKNYRGKYTNVGSYKTAESIGMHFEKEYPDPDNKITHVSVIFRGESRE